MNRLYIHRDISRNGIPHRLSITTNSIQNTCTNEIFIKSTPKKLQQILNYITTTVPRNAIFPFFNPQHMNVDI